MDDSLRRRGNPAIETLRTRKHRLEAEAGSLASEYAGLRDIDVSLELVAAGLALSCELLRAAAEGSGSADVPGTASADAMRAEAQAEARAALQHFAELRSANISLDQENLVRQAPGYAEVRRRFEQLMLAGGAILLEDTVANSRRLRQVARALAGSVRKYLAPDDRYVGLFRSEGLPGFLRPLVSLLFHMLAPEKQAEPPYGIEEGDEQTYCSARMTLPLSQAVVYLESELLPKLGMELAGSPGDAALQAQIRAAGETLEQYRRLSFSPRSQPLILEKGYYTRGLTGYTEAGEMLVTLAIPVRFRSGTNVSRMQELVLAEFVRRLAGKGVSPGLDAHYRYLQSLESGRGGSSRLPGFRLHTGQALAELKAGYPYLARLTGRQEFIRCIEIIRREGRRAPRQLLRLLESAEPAFRKLPFPEPGLPPESVF
jgi:hypothetical protein